MLLNQLFDELMRRPVEPVSLTIALVDLLRFLTTPEGRTEANCYMVDYFFTFGDWEGEFPDLPERFTDILSDMAGALHDTISSPHIAYSFESTPEQLLDRVTNLEV